jgi:hypothetical protein
VAEAKTKATKLSVAAFLAKLADKERRADCQAIVKLMQAASGESPTMWGSSIIGFGRYTLRYAGGREAEWPIIGFSPRKNDLTLYVGLGSGKYTDLLAKLGKHKTGKGCLYLKRLDDVDRSVLKRLIETSVKAKSSDRVES